MAIKAFYEENDTTDIIVHSPDFDDDSIPIEYLFRGFDNMPALEQEALKLCRGRVLDVGCGAGSHALYLQNQKNLRTEAIDTSPGAIEIARKRGLQNAYCEDFFKIAKAQYDTILMLMNGSGIIGKLDNLEQFFAHSRSLLKADGQILMDSSDLIYLFDDELEESNQYYGEFNFQVSYKDSISENFAWLYIDPVLLEEYARKNGFRSEILYTGDNYEYLARLTVK